MSKQTIDRKRDQREEKEDSLLSRRSGEVLLDGVTLTPSDLEAYSVRLAHCVRSELLPALGLQGHQAAYPSLALVPQSRILYVNKFYEKRVGILSGAMAGSEPFPAGCVGEGMLSGCVVGTFQSPPTPEAVLLAIKKLAVRNPGGVLVLAPNYSHLVVNMALACERARRSHIKVEMMVIEDDICENTFLAKKRGLLGSIFAFKLAGGLSTAGTKLPELCATVKALGCRGASLAVGLGPGSLPGQPPQYSVPLQEAVLGVGLQGDLNYAIVKVESLEKLLNSVVDRLVNYLKLAGGTHVAVMVSSLGTLTNMELAMATGILQAAFQRCGMVVSRLYLGQCMTWLDTYGLQVCCVDLTYRLDWLQLLDLLTDAPAWPGTLLSIPPRHPARHVNMEMEEKRAPVPDNCMQLSRGQAALLERCLEAACTALVANRDRLDRLDGPANANTGTCLAKIATCVLGQLGQLASRRVGITLSVVSKLVEQEGGGTSAALYALMLRGAARHATDWLSAATGAVDILLKYTSARLGHRTMVDAVVGAWQAYSSALRERPADWLRAVGAAVEGARAACLATKDMVPRAGLMSCVSPRAVRDVDAGAQAVVLWLEAVHQVLASAPHQHPQ